MKFRLLTEGFDLDKKVGDLSDDELIDFCYEVIDIKPVEREFSWGSRSWDDGSYAHEESADVDFEYEVEVEHAEDEPDFRYVIIELNGDCYGTHGTAEIEVEAYPDMTLAEFKKEVNSDVNYAADEIDLDGGDFDPDYYRY